MGAALLAPATSIAVTEPAYYYNDVMPSAGQCIPPKDANLGVNGAPIEVYAFNGTDTKFRLNGLRDWDRAACPDGQLRIQPFESLKIGGRETWFNRGAGGKTYQDSKAIPLGHVSVGDLKYRPSPLVSTGRNGRACTYPNRPVAYNNPQGTRGTLPDSLYYRSGGGSWGNYGDPAQTSGSFKPAGVHFNDLLWNWKWDEHTGGGQARALMMKNEAIRPCDVNFYSSDGYNSSGAPVAKVIGMYGRIRNSDGTLVYGWFVDAWRYNSWAPGAWSVMVSSKPIL